MKLPYLKFPFALPIVFLGFSFTVRAQEINDLDAHDIVQKLTAKLTEVYPFPEISEQYKKALLKQEAKGEYKNL